MAKHIPFSKDELEKIIESHKTPFHLYDEKAMLENLKQLQTAFSIFPGFKEYFAVKACPNPYIMESLKQAGCGMDCSSLAELILSEAVGVTKEGIMFTSNNTKKEEFQKAQELGAIINFDDITHLEFYQKYIGPLPELVCFRYNPGPLKDGNDIIGKPEEAKYGLTREQMFDAYTYAKNSGVKRFGIHTMVASNELQIPYFVETANILFKLAKEIENQVGIQIEFVNLGGGIGIPYRPEQEKVDYKILSQALYESYENIFTENKPKIFLECGRIITGPYGYLVTQAIHEKHIYREYIGVDTCMVDLMRPGMYGAYHHISVLGKEDKDKDQKYDIVGSLCENNDKFAIGRPLPKIDIGDILVIHDTGAHGYAMGFNYNGKLKSKELLKKADGALQVIRRAQTLEDYFSTLEYPNLKKYV